MHYSCSLHNLLLTAFGASHVLRSLVGVRSRFLLCRGSCWFRLEFAPRLLPLLRGASQHVDTCCHSRKACTWKRSRRFALVHFSCLRSLLRRWMRPTSSRTSIGRCTARCRMTGQHSAGAFCDSLRCLAFCLVASSVCAALSRRSYSLALLQVLGCRARC